MLLPRDAPILEAQCTTTSKYDPREDLQHSSCMCSLPGSPTILGFPLQTVLHVLWYMHVVPSITPGTEKNVWMQFSHVELKNTFCTSMMTGNDLVNPLLGHKSPVGDRLSH